MRRTPVVTNVFIASVVLALAIGPFVRGFAQTPTPPAGDEFNTSAFQAPFTAFCDGYASRPCPDAQAAYKWNLNQESPGQLRIWTQPGSLLITNASGSNNARNLILQSANAGADYTTTTRLTFPANASSVNSLGQTAGILVYQDDYNFIYACRTFDVGGSQLQFAQVIKGGASIIALPEQSIPQTVYLRIVKSGTTYSGYYSYDNGTFSPITLSSGTSNLTPGLDPIVTATPQTGVSYLASYSAPRVGLFAWGGPAVGASYSQYAADFDWFRVGDSTIAASTASVTGMTTPATSTATATATSMTTPTATYSTYATTVPTATYAPYSTPTTAPPPARPGFRWVSLWYYVVMPGTYDHLEVQAIGSTVYGIWAHVYFPSGQHLDYYETTDDHGHWAKNFTIPFAPIRNLNVAIITLRLWKGSQHADTFVHFTLDRGGEPSVPAPTTTPSLSFTFDALHTTNTRGQSLHAFHRGDSLYSVGGFTISNAPGTATVHIRQAYTYWNAPRRTWLAGPHPFDEDIDAANRGHFFHIGYTIPRNLAAAFTRIRITDAITIRSQTQRRAIVISILP